ncbi:hypothetical protein BH688_10590 [Kushneria phosphatilytica]|nr:hypothetical protein BH688_10590 [Kushneria phosphatilytica]
MIRPINGHQYRSKHVIASRLMMTPPAFPNTVTLHRCRYHRQVVISILAHSASGALDPDQEMASIPARFDHPELA